jgi:hypothetical protein
MNQAPFDKMLPFTQTLFIILSGTGIGYAATCRSTPGDASFPSVDQWNALNSSVDGRLVRVLPSAQDCLNRGGCTDDEWISSRWRAENLPGSMLEVNATIHY